VRRPGAGLAGQGCDEQFEAFVVLADGVDARTLFKRLCQFRIGPVVLLERDVFLVQSTGQMRLAVLGPSLVAGCRAVQGEKPAFQRMDRYRVQDAAAVGFQDRGRDLSVDEGLDLFHQVSRRTLAVFIDQGDRKVRMPAYIGVHLDDDVIVGREDGREIVQRAVFEHFFPAGAVALPGFVGRVAQRLDRTYLRFFVIQAVQDGADGNLVGDAFGDQRKAWHDRSKTFWQAADQPPDEQFRQAEVVAVDGLGLVDAFDFCRAVAAARYDKQALFVVVEIEAI